MTWTLLRTGLILVLLASLALPSNLGYVVPVAAAGSIVSAPGPDGPIPQRYIHAVNANGDLLVSVDNSSDTAASWIQKGVLAPPLQGVNWATFDQVFPGGDGVIYAIDSTGSLRYFRLLDPWRNAVAMSWSADSNTVIKTGLGIGSQWAGFTRMGDMATSLLRGGTLWLGVSYASSQGQFYMHGWKNGG